MKKLPKFKSEKEKQTVWSTADSNECVEWSKARHVVLPDLTPSLKTISLRLSESMIEGLTVPANTHDIPYQSLPKMFLAERVHKELKWIKAQPKVLA